MLKIQLLILLVNMEIKIKKRHKKLLKILKELENINMKHGHKSFKVILIVVFSLESLLLLQLEQHGLLLIVIQKIIKILSLIDGNIN